MSKRYKTEPLIVYLPKKLKQRLKDRADYEARPMSQLTRSYIEKGLEIAEKRDKRYE